MKTKILAALILAFAISLNAQELKVPAKVKDSFAKLYPKVKDVKWGKEGKNEFEAEFKFEGKAISAVLDGEGNLKETETDIEKSALPKSVEEFVTENNKGWTITEAAKIVDAKGNVTFEAQISKGKDQKDLIFDKNGKPVVKNDSKEKNEKHEKNEKEDKN